MRRVAALGMVLALSALAAPAAAAPDAARNILVFAGNGNPRVVASIHKLECRKVRVRPGRTDFVAKGSGDGWKLQVRVNYFDGFHDYDLEYGIRRNNFQLDPPGGGSFYANFFFPGDQPPPLSGNLKFAPRGRKLGISFPAAFSSGSDDDAVAIVGNAKCT